MNKKDVLYKIAKYLGLEVSGVRDADKEFDDDTYIIVSDGTIAGTHVYLNGEPKNYLKNFIFEVDTDEGIKTSWQDVRSKKEEVK